MCRFSVTSHFLTVLMDLLTLQNALPAVLIYQSFLIIDPITPFPKLQNERQFCSNSSSCCNKLTMRLETSCPHPHWNLETSGSMASTRNQHMVCFKLLALVPFRFISPWPSSSPTGTVTMQCIIGRDRAPQSQNFISSFHFFRRENQCPEKFFYQVITRWWFFPTHLKHILLSQIGLFPKVGANIKNVWVATTQRIFKRRNLRYIISRGSQIHFPASLYAIHFQGGELFVSGRENHFTIPTWMSQEVGING